MKIACALLPILFIGCATSDPSRLVKIDSNPPGARIFYGTGPQESDADKTRAYIGTTPLEYKITGDGAGRFKSNGGALIYSTFVPGACVFTAEPPNGTNLFSKRQVFHTGGIVSPPDRIPEGLFFDLTKP